MSRTPCLKQVPYLKFKWEQGNSNPQLLSSQTKTQPFSQTGLISWVFVYELSSCGVESHCCHLKKHPPVKVFLSLVVKENELLA